MTVIPTLPSRRVVRPESPILRRLREWRELREDIERNERQYEEAKRRAFRYEDWWAPHGRELWDVY